MGITAAEEEISANTYTSGSPGFIGIVAEVDQGHDCSGRLLSDTTVTYPIQRRSDDTSNQNLYKTSGDVAAAAAANMGVTFARGSAVGDITRAHIKAGNPATPTYDAAAAVSVIAVVTTVGAETTTITTVGANVRRSPTTTSSTSTRMARLS